MKSKVDVDSLDPVRRFFVLRADEVGLDWQQISKLIGRNSGYIYEFIVGGTPAVLPEETRGKIAKLLQVDEDRLRHTPKLDVTGERPTQPGDLIPVYRDTGSIAEGEAIDAVPRPPTLPAKAKGFGVWVSRDAGRLRAGDLLICDPRPPPRPGDLVVVERERLVAALGELRSIEPDVWQVDSGRDVAHIAREGAQLVKVVVTQHA